MNLTKNKGSSFGEQKTSRKIVIAFGKKGKAVSRAGKLPDSGT